MDLAGHAWFCHNNEQALTHGSEKAQLVLILEFASFKLLLEFGMML